ncbi:non-canonical purine NTP diphosphatase [Flavobacterium sp. Fl-318]|uniref:dITP/XTP pyrophosphatase n=1 Tax=Flavobacterium cupriresistens TaxID=2893885 RepID=A0ABU4R6U6_9FLAO|nr:MULTISPECIES: non-canonical purine NTP diphosphatase [unclassified Flavobacterium]MDX6188309.1 non-canonical purine NTP diphosphatase [Flavobacterium sp. Fl-318]UFH40650.1 non-canonical purine NTP diphosphatase [Flavobacterium sp. F-323]
MNLVFASNNKNKIKEIQSILPDSIKILSLEEIGCHEDIAETADTIEGNAILKADYVSKNYGYDCFADDTGLEVTALNGVPGVYSARYAGEHRDANDNMDKLLDALSDQSDRSAQFKTVITLNLKGEQHLFTGIVKGTITLTKAGDEGFGYDPIFQPENYTETFAQLPLEIKNKIGHRGKATQQLIDFLNSAK